MKTRRTLDAIVAGEANVDLLLDDVPELELDKEILAGNASLVLGGSSSITAFNLARLGARVGFVGVVGDDMFGGFVRQRLKFAGVDVKHLRSVKQPASGITVWCNRGARRAGVTYAGTIALLRAKDVSSEYLSKAAHLHVGAYFLLASLHAGAAALFRRARKLGLTTSLDCNWDPADQWDSGIRAVLEETDIFFPNEMEALRLTGCADVPTAAAELGKLARIVAVKLGPSGAYVHTRRGCFETPGRKVKVVDTTGAGDSFNAGFLRAFTQGEPLEDCARAGVAEGARAVSRIGGT